MDAVAIAPARPMFTYEAGPMREVLLPVGAVLATIALPFNWIAFTFVIVGHAHFLMAYLYQYRGKKMDLRYVAAAVLLLAASAWYFLAVGSITPILVVSGILFALHFAIDEFTLHGEQFGKAAWASIAAFTVLFSSLVLVIPFPTLGVVSVVVAAGVAVFGLARLALGKPTPAERYLWLVEALIFILAVGFGLPGSVLGVILLLHFANWYVGYGLKLRARPDRARTYWMEVAVTLAIAGAAFFLYMKAGAPLGIFFAMGSYYAWAIAHILLSFVSAIPRRA